MSSTLANLAVVVATLATVAFLLPQILKLLRTGDSSGVSTTWPALGLVSNIGWFAYLLSQELWLSVVAPLVMLVSYGVTMWALARNGQDLIASYNRGVVWAALLAVTTMTWGWITLGVVLGLSYGVMLAPALWTAYRTSRPSGISAGTWWIGLVEAVLWGYYGLFYADVGIVTFSVLGLIGSALMLARLWATRRLIEVPLEA